MSMESYSRVRYIVMNLRQQERQIPIFIPSNSALLSIWYMCVPIVCRFLLCVSVLPWFQECHYCRGSPQMSHP